MRTPSPSRAVLALCTLLVHVLLLGWLYGSSFGRTDSGDRRQGEPTAIVLHLPPLPRPATPPTVARPKPRPTRLAAPLQADYVRRAPQQAPASMAAPPAPSAEDWAFAARYTLKNSKAYRHTWAQQVRSMMGTAVEGPDQGVVRLRIEIAPSGRVARVDTLWSTSARAEQLARQAIAQLPTLPPTPSGQPLVFEKTISFQPFATDGPPLYKYDCEPDPPAHRNRFAWDGKGSPSVRPPPERAEPLTGQALEDCRKQLPPDTIEAEQARDRRVLERWNSKKSGV